MSREQDNTSAAPVQLDYGQAARRPVPGWVKRLLVFFVMFDVLGLILIFVVHSWMRMPWRASIFMGFGSGFIVSLLPVILYNGSPLYPPPHDGRLHSIRFGRRSQ